MYPVIFNSTLSVKDERSVSDANLILCQFLSFIECILKFEDDFYNTF